jgi:hypothetical protein
MFQRVGLITSKIMVLSVLADERKKAAPDFRIDQIKLGDVVLGRGEADL